MLTTGRLVGAAIFVGAAFIFILDLTPIRGAADGAAYGLIVAAAGYFGRRAVIRSSILAAALTILGPFLGAEGDETLVQIVAGRGVGLLVIAVLAGAILHLLDVSADAAAREQVIAAHHKALLEIVRRALFSDEPLKTRFEHVTELSATTLDSVCGALAEDSGRFLKIYDSWDRRLACHLTLSDVPAGRNPEFRELIRANEAVAVDDVLTSPLCRMDLDTFTSHNVRAVLHAGAMYGDREIGSLIATHSRPHHWTEREIAFAKSVSHIAALIFSLHQSERTLRRLDLVSQAIFVEGEGGKIEYANHAARDLAGCKGADCPVPALPFALDPLLTDSDQHEIHFNGRDLEVHRAQLPNDGTLIRIDDVTARNAALAESRAMEARLEQSAKLQAMGQLAAGVAHDFNNILGAIMGFAQLLTKTLETRPADRGFAERILGVCKKGKALIDEILTLARSSAMERNVVDVAGLFENPADVLPDNSSTHLSVTVAHEPLLVSGNAVQLARLIQNLVVNASHACEGIDGRITVSAGSATPDEVRSVFQSAGNRHERILGTPDITQRYCFLRVADNGHGIAPETMDRIFEPFFTTKGRRQGSGLGLAVVLSVAESHSGWCHVRSEPGAGTVFTIYLPLLTDASAATAIGDAEKTVRSALEGTEKVLIVDDDIDLAEVLAAGLEQLGYNVVAFSDPLEALAAIRQSVDGFDVLVTDHFMPKMHGLELVSAVRSTHHAIKILLCSGANMPSLEEAARVAGADAFLRKPFSATDIALQIRSLLRDKFAAVA